MRAKTLVYMDKYQKAYIRRHTFFLVILGIVLSYINIGLVLLPI